MEIINPDKEGIKKAAAILKSGGIGIFPTDTVFGIGCIPQKEVLDRFYEVKAREPQKPTAILVSSFEQLKEVVGVSEKARKIIEKFWPGDLTLVLEGKKEADLRILSNGFIGVRWPNFPVLEEIIKETGPLATSSANKPGENVPTAFGEIDRSLMEKVEFVLQMEIPAAKPPSTVAKIEKDNIVILREGRITLGDLENA